MLRKKTRVKIYILFACCLLVPALAGLSGGAPASLLQTAPEPYAPAALPLEGHTIALNAGHTRATNALVPYNGDGVGAFSADGRRLLRYPGNPFAIKSGTWQGVLRESDLNEDIVARTARRLEALGARVHTTRIESTEATFWGRRANLYARAESANRAKASLLLDIHLNAGHPGSRGFVFFIPTPNEQRTNFRPGRSYVLFDAKKHTPFDDRRQEASLELARLLHKSFTSTARGVNPIPPYRWGTIHISRFVVINKASMPAVLVECGFMSTEADMNHLASAEYRENLAGRLADAVREYIEGASKNSNSQ